MRQHPYLNSFQLIVQDAELLMDHFDDVVSYLVVEDDAQLHIE
jgi:hypothetical protein